MPQDVFACRGGHRPGPEVHNRGGVRRSRWLVTMTKLNPDGTINHTYFPKSMKTPFVVMQRSAMSIKQKLNILANDIIRRDGCEWSAGLDEKTTEE